MTQRGHRTGSNQRHTAQIRLPPWVWGGNPAGFLTSARLHNRARDYGFDIRTQESYLRRPRPQLIDNALVLGSNLRRGGGYDSLSSLTDDKIEASILQDVATRFDLDRRSDVDSLPSLVKRLQEDLTLCSREELPGVITSTLTDLQSLTFDSGTEPVFPESEVFWIRRDEALVHRVKLASVLLRLQHDERLTGGDVRHIVAEHGAGANIFASSAALSDGVFIFDAYVAPLLAALSPAVWGFPVHRIHGTIIISYGRPISGTASEPCELLRTLRTVTSVHDGRRYVRFSSSQASESAITWWAGRLDELFGILTDPAVYSDAVGQYDPTASLQALLSVEQVFRRTNSLLLADHDTHARRASALTVMDTLRSLSGINLDRLFHYDHAAAVLARLKSTIPVNAQEVLLPAAMRAVEALRDVQDGFFMRNLDDTVTIGNREVRLATAAAEYLAMLRDATHGFSTTRRAVKQKEKVATLLAVHNGNVPHDVGLLAWLYLLDLLAEPARFRLVMARHQRR